MTPSDVGATSSKTHLERLVDSLLFEGYALYPYTPGAIKNATPTPTATQTAAPTPTPTHTPEPTPTNTPVPPTNTPVREPRRVRGSMAPRSSHTPGSSICCR